MMRFSWTAHRPWSNSEFLEVERHRRVSASAASTDFGQPVTFRATVGVVRPAAGTATAAGSASVVFMDGGQALSGAVAYTVVNGQLVAALTTSKLKPGDHSITAVYSGDTNFLASQSNPIKQIVSHAATTLTVSSSNALPTFGQAVTLVSTIGTVLSGAGTPPAAPGNATVEFWDGSSRLSGTVTYHMLNGKVVATLVTSNLSPGIHPIRAVYSGDAFYLGSRSAVFKQTVLTNKTTCVVSSSVAKPVFGQSVTVTAIVSVTWQATGFSVADATAGTVEFLDGNRTLTGAITYRVINGTLVATLTTTDLTAGIHSLTAQYSGNANSRSCTSAVFKQTVFHAGTTALISATATSVHAGEAVTFTVEIGVIAPGVGIPTAGVGSAKVTFLDGTDVISGVVVYRVVDGKLVASLTTTDLKVGVHSITATYSGDANFLARTSKALKEIVV